MWTQSAPYPIGHSLLVRTGVDSPERVAAPARGPPSRRSDTRPRAPGALRNVPGGLPEPPVGARAGPPVRVRAFFPGVSRCKTTTYLRPANVSGSIGCCSASASGCSPPTKTPARPRAAGKSGAEPEAPASTAIPAGTPCTPAARAAATGAPPPMARLARAAPEPESSAGHQRPPSRSPTAAKEHGHDPRNP